MSRAGSGVDPFNTDAAGGEGYVYTTAAQFSSRHVLARHLQLILATGRLEGRSVVDIGCGDGFSTFRFWDEAHPARMAGVDPAPNAMAVIQGALHHADDPQATIREGLRVARELVVLEPNGLNPGLKLLEKVSKYHREHNERSYSRRRLRGWAEAAGGRVVEEKFGVFVPIFSPDWLARPMAAVEPAVEAIPGVRAIGCSVYVMRATH